MYESKMIPVEELLADHQLYHSEFQQDRFITIKSGGTPYGCYRQALREIQKRYSAVQELELQIEEARIDLEEMPENGDRRNSIQKRRKTLQIEGLELTLNETRRELNRFHEQAAGLKSHIGELTDARRAELDREFWEHRIRSMMAVECHVYGRPGTSTIELLQCIPKDMQVRLLAHLESPEAIRRLTVDYFSDRADLTPPHREP